MYMVLVKHTGVGRPNRIQIFNHRLEFTLIIIHKLKD